jgi:XTP/dITP diphosphohydrolase
MTQVILASSNAHKLEELQALFGAAGEFDFVLAPRPLEVEETGTTFAENARLKAEAYARAFNAPALADDSGLCVDALGGRPGVHSARYAPTDAERIAKLLDELDGVVTEGRAAAFVCAMALHFPDGRVIEVEGRCPGVITEGPRGEGGFGYDPVFLVPSLGKTFAELTAAEKNAVSHRALATARLREALATAKI